MNGIINFYPNLDSVVVPSSKGRLFSCFARSFVKKIIFCKNVGFLGKWLHYFVVFRAISGYFWLFLTILLFLGFHSCVCNIYFWLYRIYSTNCSIARSDKTWFWPILWLLLFFQLQSDQPAFESTDFDNAVILVFAFLSRKLLSVPNLAGMLKF